MLAITIAVDTICGQEYIRKAVNTMDPCLSYRSLFEEPNILTCIAYRNNKTIKQIISRLMIIMYR